MLRRIWEDVTDVALLVTTGVLALIGPVCAVAVWIAQQ
jgi:hypothetical protein